MTNKKRVIIGNIVILLLSIIYHNVYEKFPNFLTSLFFPMSESIWEHNKMILMAFITWTIIEIFTFKNNKNSIFKNIVACVICIILVISIFTPVYFLILKQNDNFVVTIIIYLVSIILSLIISNFIKIEQSSSLEKLSVLGYITLLITFAIMTYYHPNGAIFKEFKTANINNLKSVTT